MNRTKRTVVVNTERNTREAWGGFRVMARGHGVRKSQSNLKPPHKCQRWPFLPGLSDTKGAAQL